MDFGNFGQSQAVSLVSTLNAKLIMTSTPSSYTAELSDGSFNMNTGLPYVFIQPLALFTVYQ